MRRLTGILAVAAVLFAMGVASRLPASAEDATTDAAPFTSMTWNMCGWKHADAHGCPDGPAIEERAAQAAKFVQDNDVEVVFLQEVCQEHTRVLESTLGDNWTVHHFAYQSRNGDQDVVRWCGNEHDGPAGSAGMAIGVKEPDVPTEARQRYDLPRDETAGSWRHQMVCLDTTSHGKLCTVHLTWLNEYVDGRLVRAAQIETMAEILGGTENVTVGGDFNNSPSDDPKFPPDTDPQIVEATNPMYELFTECDQVNYPGEHNGSPTNRNGRKLDFIFSTNTFASCELQEDPDVGTGDMFSDHFAMIGG